MRLRSLARPATLTGAGDTEALLTPTADVVAVAGTVPPGDLGEDQASRASSRVATLTEQHPLEVVLVNAVPRTEAATASVENVLHDVEERLIDQRLMTTRDQLTLVLHETDVVRIPQDGVERAGAAAAASTIASPIPLFPPVTTTDLPSNNMSTPSG